MQRLKSALQLEDLGVRVATVLKELRRRRSRARTAFSAKPSKLPRVVSLGKLGLQPIPVFTYLANSIRKGDRQIPYSLVTATDLGQVPEVDGAAGAATGTPSVAPGVPAVPSADAIVLNGWASLELEADTGRSGRR